MLLLNSQRMRVRWLSLGLLVAMLPAFAMDLPHYDLDSLSYTSTDAVIAHLSVSPQHKIMATVSETIYGSLHAGDTLDKLSEFLSFFQPMEDGQDVILFLDSRPRTPDFFHREASSSPFAVPPSGVYLIDSYQHVHEYFQQNNPGPYVAEGYGFFFEKTAPTREQDLALPTLEEVKTRILASRKKLAALRPLLDKTATQADAPPLLGLLRARVTDRMGCFLSYYDPIAGRIAEQIRSLNDPELMLRLHRDFPVDIRFVTQQGVGRDPTFTASRVKYLLGTLGDAKKDLTLRTAAIEILIGVSKFHSGAQTGPSRALPIDNEWLAGSAREIGATAKAVFDDNSQSGHLRALCLQFLALDQAAILDDIKRVYRLTQSAELRFAIERSLLEINDSLYQSLNPPGGPIASIVMVAPAGGCVTAAASEVVFLASTYERQDYHDRQETAVRMQYVMTNSQSRQRFAFGLAEIHLRSGWGSVRESQSWFELAKPADFPTGEYTLGLEYELGGDIFSAGYTVKVKIADGTAGKTVSAN